MLTHLQPSLNKNHVSPSNFPLCPSFFFAGKRRSGIIIAGNKVEQLHRQDEAVSVLHPSSSHCCLGPTENHISCLGRHKLLGPLGPRCGSVFFLTMPGTFRAFSKIQWTETTEAMLKRFLIILEGGGHKGCLP